jgi:hypothetical protein
MRIKIFSKSNPVGRQGQNQHNFEHEINEWLHQNKGAEIVRVEQCASGGSFSPSLWMISVWYTQP